MRVCSCCKQAIESHEGPVKSTVVYTDETNESESRCDWCEEVGFDILYEIE